MLLLDEGKFLGFDSLSPVTFNELSPLLYCQPLPWLINYFILDCASASLFAFSASFFEALWPSVIWLLPSALLLSQGSPNVKASGYSSALILLFTSHFLKSLFLCRSWHFFFSLLLFFCVGISLCLPLNLGFPRKLVPPLSWLPYILPR